MSSKHLDAELIRKFKADHLLTPGGTVDAYLGRVVNATALADGFAASVTAFDEAVDELVEDVDDLAVPSGTTDDLDAAEAAVAAMQTDPTVVGDGSYDLEKLNLDNGDAIAYGVNNTGNVVLELNGAPSGTAQVNHVICIPAGSGVTSLSCDSGLGQYDNPLADFDPAKMYVVYISMWVSPGSDYVFVVTGRVLT